jgi:hypothetical protein
VYGATTQSTATGPRREQTGLPGTGHRWLLWATYDSAPRQGSVSGGVDLTGAHEGGGAGAWTGLVRACASRAMHGEMTQGRRLRVEGSQQQAAGCKAGSRTAAKDQERGGRGTGSRVGMSGLAALPSSFCSLTRTRPGTSQSRE